MSNSQTPSGSSPPHRSLVWFHDHDDAGGGFLAVVLDHKTKRVIRIVGTLPASTIQQRHIRDSVLSEARFVWLEDRHWLEQIGIDAEQLNLFQGKRTLHRQWKKAMERHERQAQPPKEADQDE